MGLRCQFRARLSVELIVPPTRRGIKGVAFDQIPATRSAQLSMTTAAVYMQVRHLCNVASRPAINGKCSAMGLDRHRRVLFHPG